MVDLNDGSTQEDEMYCTCIFCVYFYIIENVRDYYYKTIKTCNDA